MTTPTARRSRREAARVAQAAGIAAAAAARDEVDVLGLGDEAVLASIAESQVRAERAQVDQLRAVAVWTDRHRITDPEQWAISGDALEMLEDLENHPGKASRLTHEAGELGTEGILRLAGEGAFMVREFAVTDLAVTLAMSEQAARHYVAQTVELRDRLPRLWGQVMAGRLPVWKARRVAEQTIPLKAATAGFVDAQLERVRPPALPDPDHQVCGGRDHPLPARPRRTPRRRGGRGPRGLGRGRHHRRHHPDRSHPRLTRCPRLRPGTGRHRDRARAHSATAPAGSVRRARAVGVLADPQYAIDLATAATTPTVDGPAKVKRSAASPVFHLHLHTSCRCGSDSEGASVFGPVTRVQAEGLHSWRPGPVPTAAVERWLTGLTPGTRIETTRVVDLTEQIAVDAYEHPAALARQVSERDHTCAFPWCGRQGATYDLDHIDPYVSPDDGGPPGQTSTANTARLCRYHHRVKTHGHWRYQRTGPTAVTWTSPQGRTYTVDHTGTHAD